MRLTFYTEELSAMKNGTFTDWQDLISRRGSQVSNQISITGGNERNQYAVSGNLLKQIGVTWCRTTTASRCASTTRARRATASAWAARRCSCAASSGSAAATDCTRSDQRLPAQRAVRQRGQHRLQADARRPARQPALRREQLARTTAFATASSGRCSRASRPAPGPRPIARTSAPT